MILPSAAARFWVGNIVPLLLTAIVIAFSGSIIGLLLSYYVNLPAGPAIVLTLGGLYVLSMVIGPLGPILTRLRPRWHFER
jgi:zinc/manganese transport system permease protein